ncbi:ATP-binding protein [Aurantibacillus circumpalustris]|uniref:ATP-binding protein n=1 Tax=Aurantibacillus circumpalustris TaxID=3036359 RepID=UPI00295AC2BA|nr:ATP-binding protein [Aurantibacillus circumpalustris]
MITTEAKSKIVKALKEQRGMYIGSDKGFSTKIGINAAQWSRLSNGNFFQVVSDGQWISLARLAEVDLKGNSKWNTAKTPVYNTITAQLKKCQEKSISAIFCDDAGIGKTYSARVYVRENKGAVYIDCSQVKTRQKLVRQIAREFGVEHVGKYSNVYGDLCYYITSAAHNPLVILDEVGDLEYSAFLELKALWNATENACGWYMMGADGLKEKIRRSIECKRVGYAEIFSRYGKRYQRSTPMGADEQKAFTMAQATAVIKANAPEGVDVQKILIKTEGSLRRIPTELKKL